MLQWLRALAAIPGEPGSVLGTHMTSHSLLWFQHPLLTSMGTRHTYGVYTHRQKHSCIFSLYRADWLSTHRDLPASPGFDPYYLKMKSIELKWEPRTRLIVLVFLLLWRKHQDQAALIKENIDWGWLNYIVQRFSPVWAWKEACRQTRYWRRSWGFYTWMHRQQQETLILSLAGAHDTSESASTTTHFLQQGHTS